MDITIYFIKEKKQFVVYHVVLTILSFKLIGGIPYTDHGAQITSPPLIFVLCFFRLGKG